MASYQELLTNFMQVAPPDVLALQGTDAFGDAFNKWTADIMADLGVSDWEQIPVGELANYEYIGAGGNAAPALPAEQAIFNQIAPTIQQQIAGDAGRQAQVADLTQQTNAAFGDLKTVLGAAAMAFDGQQYFRDNPDVAAAYAANSEGLSADDFAKRHYETFGKNEGRQPAYTSEVMRNQVAGANRAAAAQGAAASTAAQAQLGALQQSITQMQGSLQGALGQQAAALAQNVAALQANLNTLDASQRAALAQQIADQQRNLERSIAAQREALAQQVADLQGNASAAAAARRAALEQQIAELTAAQAPVAEARLRGAEALTTAINLGLEGTRDQLRADAAAEGFVGGSTMQDSALARATIGARQEAARVGADARLANATDTRDIARTGAGGRYSIADAYATDRQRIDDMGAGGRAGLSVNLATGTQAIGDFGATGRRGIADTTAANRANVDNYGAMRTYGNSVAGIWANNALQNAGAQGQYSIATELARQQQDIANRNAGAKVGYNDQLFPAAVNAAQIKTGLPAAQAGALTALIPFGTAGTRNALDVLNWWSTNATPPTPTAVTTAPGQTGNQIAGLGAGLVGAGFQLGNANDWWRPTPAPKAKTTTPGGTSAGGANLWTSPLT